MSMETRKTIDNEQVSLLKVKAIATDNPGLVELCDCVLGAPSAAEVGGYLAYLSKRYDQLGGNTITIECHASEDPWRPWVYATAKDGFGVKCISATLDYVLEAAQKREWTIANPQDVLFWLQKNAEIRSRVTRYIMEED